MAARDSEDSSDMEFSSANSWQDESNILDEEEERPTNSRSDTFSGIPRPTTPKDSEIRKASDRRRRYPGVEDLDMENL
jgi:hypothetical protein